MLRNGFLAWALVTGSVMAAPVDSGNQTGPTMTVQTRSLSYLLTRLKSTVTTVLGEQAAASLRQGLEQSVQPYLKAINLDKPLGLYATIKDNWFATELVLLIPVRQPDGFVRFLKDQGLEVQQTNDTPTYAVTLPGLPLPVYLRFHKSYAYLSPGSTKPIDAENRLSPASVIDASTKEALVFRFRLDRLSNGLKQNILASWQQLERVISNPDEQGGMVALGAAELALLSGGKELISRWLPLLLNQGRLLEFRFDLTPKTGEFITDFALEALPDTELKAMIGDYRTRPNHFRGLAQPDSVASFLFRMPLFAPELRNGIISRIKESQQQGLSQLPKSEHAILKAVCAAVIRTVDSGSMDGLMELRGPDQDGHYRVFGAQRVVDTAALVAAARAFVAKLPEAVRKQFAFDVAKVENTPLHRVTLRDNLGKVERMLFGIEHPTYDILAVQDAFFVTFGKPRPAELKAALALKSVAVENPPVLCLEVSLPKLIEGLNDPELAMFKDIAARLGRVTVVEMSVRGGDRLQIRTRGLFWVSVVMFGFTVAG